MAIDETEDDDDVVDTTELIDEDDDLDPEVLDDGLDIDAVEEFNEDDFDEDFDDDFEEEIVGEYDLADDQYGKEFDNTFGHLTKPKEETADAEPEKASVPDSKSEKKSAGKSGSKVATKKAPPAEAKTVKASKAAKKPPARKK